jgi:hypothetical protein
MHWIAPTERDTATETLEERLWIAADHLWAGAGLKQSEYSEPNVYASASRTACLSLTDGVRA